MRMKAILFLVIPLVVVSLTSGDTVISDGSDGPFNPTMNMTLTLPEDGIFNYTTINIPEGVTIKFINNAANTPVSMAGTGDVIINGTINVSAGGANPGPGGFEGGANGYGSGSPGQAGDGPGGGFGGHGDGSAGGGGGMATPGYQAYKSHAGPNPADGGAAVSLTEPYKGGNGGGGGGGITKAIPFTGGHGGAGSGAIQVSSPGHITIGGTFMAHGGNGGYAFANIFGHAGPGGAGSGGNVVIIGGTITLLDTAEFSLRGGYGGGISTQPYSQNPPLYSCGAEGGDGYVRLQGILNMPPGISGYTAVFECQGFAPDVTGDCMVDLSDYALLAANWLEHGCGDCSGADATGDGDVDSYDLQTIAESFLIGIR